MSAEHQILRSYSTGALLQIPIVGPTGCPGNSTPLQYSEQQASREKVSFSLFSFFPPPLQSLWVTVSPVHSYLLSSPFHPFTAPLSISQHLQLVSHVFFLHFFSLHLSLWTSDTHTHTSTAKKAMLMNES